MTPGQLDAAVVRRHLISLDQALQTLRKHQGHPVDRLRSEREEMEFAHRVSHYLDDQPGS